MVADVILAAVIGVFGYIGYKRGFVVTISKLCCWVIAAIVAKILNPYVSDFVRKTIIGEYINEKVAGMVGDDVPAFILQISKHTAEDVTGVVVGIISVLVIIIITFLLANFIMGALKIVKKLPVISSLDTFLGLVSGLATGIFAVYLVLGIFVIVDVQTVDTWIDSSIVAYHMYRHNALFDLIL